MMRGISLLIATRNRCEALGKTLHALTLVNRSGIDVEIVVVDNGSTDDTSAVLAQFKQRLPLLALTENKPGKNSALNTALAKAQLREIVVFSDDDVSPRHDWFTQILAAAEKWESTSVFGGRIQIAWPYDERPIWASSPWIEELAFCSHHYSDVEAFYQPPACPFGANFWVRRHVLERLSKFDVTIGPKPRGRIMGSETSFLMALQRLGYQILYYPGAVVTHRIEARDCTVQVLRRRAYRLGRAQVKLFGVHRGSLYKRSKLLWSSVLAAEVPYALFKFAIGMCALSPSVRAERTADAMIRLGTLRQTGLQILNRPDGIT